MEKLQKKLGFGRAEQGSVTVFALFIFVTLMMVGSYAVDVQNATRERTHLQMVADSAAHAALLTRETSDRNQAIAKAVAVAEKSMPPAIFGEVLRPQDVVFGTWDAASSTFVAKSGSRSAAKVTVYRTKENGNGLRTFLFGLVGLNNWDLVRSSVYVTYCPTCFREGFVASGVVAIRSNNSFSNGFCIHSNDYVSLNSNNYFEPGTVVSMPDLATLDIPNSGYETNLGLREALREGSYNLRILSRIESIVATIDKTGSAWRPDYITTTATTTLTKKAISAVDIVQNRVNYWNCAGNKGTVAKDTVVENVVIISPCEITFAAGVVVQNAVIVTSSTSARSFTSPSGLQVGKNDNCAAGGGAQLVTLGGMDFAAKLSVFGGQLLAKGDINFAANADGIQGAAMVAGGQISGTSNMSMSFCGTGMDQNFTASYFRLVE